MTELPIVDVRDLSRCEDYDADCAGMSLGEIERCMRGVTGMVAGTLVELQPVAGLCQEMQRRQCGTLPCSAKEGGGGSSC